MALAREISSILTWASRYLPAPVSKLSDFSDGTILILLIENSFKTNIGKKKYKVCFALLLSFVGIFGDLTLNEVFGVYLM